MINSKTYRELAIAAMRPHFDANETLFLERELTQFRAKLFEVQFPALKARTFLPKANDIAPSAETYAYKVMSPLGKAKMIAYKAGDLPRVDADAIERTGKVRPVGASFGWDLNEMREAARLGIPLSELKGRMAREAIERAIDEILAFGGLKDASGALSDVSLQGFVNNADVEGGGGANIEAGLYWFAGTAPDPADILADITDVVSLIQSDSKSVFQANSLLLPTRHYNYMKQTPFSELSGESILSVFQKNNPEITTVAPWYVLDDAGASGKPRAIVYQKDPMVAEAVIPQEFETMPPQADGLEMLINCHARCGGAKVYQPLAIRYLDFATS